MMLGGVRHHDAADQELVPRRDQEAVRADRAGQGLHERQVLYGHVFRNAMLIVIAGFPGAFVARVLLRLAADRDDLLARRPRPARLRERAQPRLSGGVRHALHLRADRPRREPDLRPHLHLDRSAHRFRDAGGLRWTPASRKTHRPRADHAGRRPIRRRGCGGSRCRRSIAGAGRTSSATGAATGRCGSSWCCSSSRCSPSSSPTTSRS